ncbi:hypothetical protein ARMGADRAFT_1038495 [Armillaria gallica]|uniref:Uncharacterized protein n=1 Tax=Armillaria gallica TaxID=47427 RepID=A0A2H3CL32_ARMGA|nr:hypothetical protein ARMGADRAFT_1038495 [Armillaria gallica]
MEQSIGAMLQKRVDQVEESLIFWKCKFNTLLCNNERSALIVVKFGGITGLVFGIGIDTITFNFICYNSPEASLASDAPLSSVITPPHVSRILIFLGLVDSNGVALGGASVGIASSEGKHTFLIHGASFSPIMKKIFWYIEEARKGEHILSYLFDETSVFDGEILMTLGKT